MPVLVDAYNALHVTGVLPPALAGPDVDRLAAYIAHSRWSRQRTSLICDGQPPNEPPRRPARGDAGRRVEILYAGSGRDADGLIESLITESSAPRRLVVVSSDRRVQAAARRRKARTLTSQAFLEALALDLARNGGVGAERSVGGAAGSPPLPLGPQATDTWIEDLGLTGDPLLALAPSAVRDRGAETTGAHADVSAQPAAGTGPLHGADRQASLRSAGSADHDALLREALEEWPDRLCADDLDMAKWLDFDDTPPDR